MTIDETIRTTVSEARRSARRTFRELSIATGISEARLREVEMGRVPRDMTVRQLKSLAEALGVSVASLIGERPATEVGRDGATAAIFAAMVGPGESLSRGDLVGLLGETEADRSIQQIAEHVHELGARVLVDRDRITLRPLAGPVRIGQSRSLTGAAIAALQRLRRERTVESDLLDSDTLVELRSHDLVEGEDKVRLPGWLREDLHLDERVDLASARPVSDEAAPAMLPAQWLDGLGRSARDGYTGDVRAAEVWLRARDAELSTATHEQLEEYISQCLRSGEAAATTRRRVAAIKRLYSVRARITGAPSPAAALVSPKAGQDKVRHLTFEELLTLIAGLLQVRDAASLVGLLGLTTDARLDVLMTLRDVSVDISPPYLLRGQSVRGEYAERVHPEIAKVAHELLAGSQSPWLVRSLKSDAPMTRAWITKLIGKMIWEHVGVRGTFRNLQLTSPSVGLAALEQVATARAVGSA